MIFSFDKIKNIKLAADTINKGKIIVYSTDTLYGFGVDATNDNCIKKLNNIKGRLQPYSIIVSSFDMLKKYAKTDDKIIQKLEKILPGPFTAILNKNNSNLSKYVSNNLSTIGIRIPDFKPILEVVELIDKPIITTSVNIHNQKSLNSIKEIQKQFPDFDIFTDHTQKKSRGSTIIDFSNSDYKILRQGDGKAKI
tara:strand:- start:2166 stop:2750 length:585 start_codon:yes stop_codon:yes gene_type:complete